MPKAKTLSSRWPGLTVLAVSLLAASASSQAQSGPAPVSPILPENITQVSQHVYVIMGFPNVAIVVGEGATLVVDTGMGPSNGATVLHAVEKLTKNLKIFLTTTHYHPEHSTGAQAFPAQTVLIRNKAQQEEMDHRGMEFIEMFRSRSELNRRLLEGVVLRPPDVLFDSEVTLDLGGITARLFWLGAAHTKGDELTMVEPDSVLIPGDIVQNKLVPGMPNEDSSVRGWLAILDKIEPLKPRYIVPDHGPLGDGSLIAQEKSFLLDIQKRALELKRQGKPVDAAGKLLAAEFKTKHSDWENLNNIPNVVKRVYAESEE